MVETTEDSENTETNEEHADSHNLTEKGRDDVSERIGGVDLHISDQMSKSFVTSEKSEVRRKQPLLDNRSSLNRISVPSEDADDTKSAQEEYDRSDPMMNMDTKTSL